MDRFPNRRCDREEVRSKRYPQAIPRNHYRCDRQRFVHQLSARRRGRSGAQAIWLQHYRKLELRLQRQRDHRHPVRRTVHHLHELKVMNSARITTVMKRSRGRFTNFPPSPTFLAVFSFGTLYTYATRKKWYQILDVWR